ncbi:MAG: glycosyltransferase family 4 protein [Planctomycetota bacterium]|jgi:glycosyltransferase involved in cell wall biosynthesis
MNTGNKTAVRVCFISPKAYPLFNPDVKKTFGGAEVDFYLLARELAKDKNFAVSFIVADYGQGQFETIDNVRIIKSLSFQESPPAGAVKIWRAMKTADAQIYLQETASWGTFLVAVFCRLHKRIFIYRTAHQRECDGTYLRENYFAGRAFCRALRTAGRAIVQNESDRNNLKQTTGVSSIVIPNAHHLPELSEAERDIILWVSRSTRTKRPGLFIELAAKNPHEKFVMICPQATYDNQYEQLSEQAGQVANLEFIERVGFDEIESYFGRAKMFVCTSKAEGFPNTYIQACKCTTPILSLAVNPDNFLGKFKCGLCADGRIAKFEKDFKILLELKTNRRFGENARRYAEEKHDIKKITGIYKDLFVTSAK